MFYKKVRKNNRRDMIDFLQNHFRYNTMNSWNQSTSYANNVKVHRLDIPKDKIDIAYEIIYDDVNADDLYDEISNFIYDFKQDTGYDVGFNGRSSGYLVLYATAFDVKQNKLVTYPGRNIDMCADFEDKSEWDMTALKSRVELVSKFDKLCDDIRDVFLQYLDEYEIVEEEIQVTKTIKTLERKGGIENG